MPNVVGNLEVKRTLTANLVDASNITTTSLSLDTTILNSPSANTRGNGIFIEGTIGESVVFGDLLYLKSDGKYWKAKADSALTIPCTAISMSTNSADDLTAVFIQGIIRNDSWTWTAGTVLYVSAGTGGLITDQCPDNTGEQVQIIGHALSATKIYFNPNYTFVEIV